MNGLLLLPLLLCATTQVSDAERDSLYRWLDKHGPESVRSGRVVRIESKSGPLFMAPYGFFIAENGETIDLTAFTLDHVSLSKKNFRISPESFERVGAEAASFLEGQQSESSDLSKLVLSWAAKERRLPALSDKLYLSVKRGPPGTFEKTMLGQLYNRALGQAISEMDDSPEARPKLLRKLEALAARHPERLQPFIGPALEVLRQMVREDASHTPLPDEVDELIWQLRNVRGYQMASPGGPDIFLDRRPDNAAARLLKIGYPAVPKLIDALTDERFTLTAAYIGSRIPAESAIVRVGGASAQILRRISGVDFYANYDAGQSWVSRQRVIQDQARAWWKEFQQKGEQKWLIETASEGNLEALERLISNYPADAPGALRSAMQTARDGWSRAHLLVLAHRLGTPDAQSIIFDRFSKASEPTEIMVASKLVGAGQPDHAITRLTEWLESHPERKDDRGDHENVIRYLLATGRPRALQTVASVLPKASSQLQSQALMMLFTDKLPPMDHSPGPQMARPTDPDLTEYRKQLEAMLLSMVPVREKSPSSGGAMLGKRSYSFYHPEIGEMAAAALSIRFPQKYSFPQGDSPLQKRQARVRAWNVLRRSRGLEPLPIPAAPIIKQASDSEVQRLAKLALSGNELANKRLNSMGLSAAPALAEYVKTLPREQAAHLRPLANKLAATIREVRIEGEADLPKAAVLGLRALRGRPLDRGVGLDVWKHILATLEMQPGKFEVHAERDIDAKGVLLTVKFRPWAHGSNWSYNLSASTTSRGISGSTGGGGNESFEFSKYLTKASTNYLAELTEAWPYESLNFWLMVSRGDE